MGLLKHLFGSIVNSNFEADANKILSVCRCYGPQERDDLKVCTLLAMASLVEDLKVDSNDLLEVMTGAIFEGKSLTNNEIGLLSKLNLKLMSHQKSAHSSTNQFVQMVSAGLPVWILSNRAASNVLLLPHARELWALIGNTDDFRVQSQIDRLINNFGRHPLADRITAMRYMQTPALFVAR